MWKQHRITPELLQYAADDVSQLPLLADTLILDMCNAQVKLVAVVRRCQQRILIEKLAHLQAGSIAS